MFFTLKNNKFLTNSLIFFFASLLGGFGNYIFHFFMVRMLAPSAYGELQALISLSVIFGVPVGVLATVIVKYTATFKVTHEEKIYQLFFVLTKKLLGLGLLSFVFLLILTRPLDRFLNLTSSTSLIIFAASFIIVFLATLNSSLLQGLQKFRELAVISIATTFLKVILGIILVKLSFDVSGAVGAIVLSGLVAYGLTFLPLKSLFKFKESAETCNVQKLPKKEMLAFAWPVLLVILFTTLFYNLDILLVKHFFAPAVAGQYAVLALLGHIVFFIIGPFITVMFPAAVEAHAANHVNSEGMVGTARQFGSGLNMEPVQKIFKKTLLMSMAIGLIALAFYFTFPSLIIKMIVGANYFTLTPYLGWFGLAMFLYSLIFLLSQYFLSINKTKFIYLLGITVILQTISISLWHSNVWQIIWIMNGVMTACLIALLIYYRFSLKH